MAEKIATKGRLKKCSIESFNCCTLTFEGVKLSGSQMEKISRLIGAEESVDLGIDIAQEDLPGFDEEDPQKEQPAGGDEGGGRRGRKKKGGKDAAAGE